MSGGDVHDQLWTDVHWAEGPVHSIYACEGPFAYEAVPRSDRNYRSVSDTIKSGIGVTRRDSAWMHVCYI